MSNATGARFSAAADAFVNGGIIVPEFQQEITDLVRRGGALGQRIEAVPATGSPSRFFEQTKIGEARFADKQNLNATATGPERIEKSVVIKAIDNRITYGLFEQETVGQQGNFAHLKAKDLKDMIQGIINLHDQALWTGNDTVNGGQVGSSGSLEYVGLLNQIGGPEVVIAKDASIVGALRLEVAKMVADPEYKVMPTAIYVNPMLQYLIEEEIREQKDGALDKVEILAGVVVPAIMTAAGKLPLIVDPYLATDALGTPGADEVHYPFAIVTEPLIEYHYVGSPEPRLFQLGTTASLVEDYVAVLFGAPVAKYADKAHRKGYAVAAKI